MQTEQRFTIRKYDHSHLAHLHSVSHVLSNVECAIFPDPDRFEIVAALKCAFSYFLERARKYNFFYPAVLETLVSNVLYFIRNSNAFEILAM